MELSNQFEVEAPVDQVWAVLTDVERIAPCMPGAKLEEVDGDEYKGLVKVKVGPITAQYKGKATFVEQDASHHRAVLRAEGRDTRGQGNASATITLTLEPEGDKTSADVVTDLTVTGKVAQFGRGVMADVSAKLLDQFVSCLHQKVITTDGGAGESADQTAQRASTDGVSAEAAEAPAAPTPAPAAAASPAPPPPTAPTAPNSPATAAPQTPAATAPAAVTATASSAPPERPAASTGARKIDSAEPEPVDLMDAAGGPVAKRAAPAAAGLGLLVLLLWLLRRRRS